MLVIAFLKLGIPSTIGLANVFELGPFALVFSGFFMTRKYDSPLVNNIMLYSTASVACFFAVGIFLSFQVVFVSSAVSPNDYLNSAMAVLFLTGVMNLVIVSVITFGYVLQRVITDSSNPKYKRENPPLI